MTRQRGKANEYLLLKKGAAALLLFSFLFPLTTLAQTTPPATDAASAPTTNTTPPPTPVDAPPVLQKAPAPIATPSTKPPVVETPPITDTTDTTGAPAPVTTDTAPSKVVALAAGSGLGSSNSSKQAISAKFLSEPDPVTGSLNYSYPITIPPGRNGMQPNLSLTYSSQPGTDINAAGYGWDTNIPYITRLNKKGTDALYSQNYFYSSLDGELLQTATSSNVYGAKVDNGSFNNYQLASSSTVWVMTDKLGTTYTFGTTSASRQDNPGNTAQIYKWMLQEVRDTNGNTVTYQYTKDRGQIYPYKIQYTANDSTPATFEINFGLENRTDVATSSAFGFTVVSGQRINQIQIKANNAVVHQYALAYGVGDNGSRSMLTSVTESGTDDVGNTTTLPATQFNYLASTKAWSATAGYTTPMPFTYGSYMADVNGDSLADIIYSYSGASTTNSTYINTGSGWVASSTWTVPMYFTSGGADQGVRVVDVNGDGLNDIVQSYGSTVGTYINTGSGWSASSTWNVPIWISSATTTDIGVRLMDVNGDGLPDIVRSVDGSTSTYLNTGNGWAATTNFVAPIDFVTSGVDKNVRFEDVNGDGLVDILQAYNDAGGTQNRVYINNGTGWTLDSTWVLPEYFSQTYASDAGVRLADLNGDGLPDVIRSYSNVTNGSSKVYINTGHGWTYDAVWGTPCDFVVDTADKLTRIADFNGDGLLDVIQGYDTGPNNKVYLNTSKKVDLLTTTTFPEGGTAKFTYKSAQEYRNGSASQSPVLPVPVNTLASVQLDNGLGVIASSNYSYAGGKYYFASSTDRQFAGFQTITKTDAVLNTFKSYYHQGDTSNTSQGEYQDIGSKIGKAYRTETYDPSGNLFTKSIIKWGSASLSGGRSFVKPLQQLDFSYDGNTSHKEKATSNTYDDTKGNLTVQTMWGQVNGSDDGTFTDTGTDMVIATTTYASSTAGRIFGPPAEIKVSDQSGTQLKDTQFYYDGQSFTNVTVGNLTNEQDWIATSSYASSSRAYNALGLVTGSTDPRGNQTTYGYDTKNLYPATTTNPLGQKTTYTYDYSSGKVATSTDANGATIAAVYDGLDRILLQKQPDTATTSPLIIATQYIYTDTALPSVHQINFLSTATSTDVYSYFDGFNRPVQQRIEAEKNGDFSTKDYTYNTLGTLQSESLPYFNNGSGKSPVSTVPALYQTYTYDPLGRVTTVTNAVGNTTNVYDDWKVTTTDANGHAKDYTYDAFGNLIKVTEHLGGTGYDTQYAYDGASHLTQITDALSNIRSFTYDGLGRLLMSQDLHAASDTTFGSSTYAYDAVGNQTSQLDAKSQLVLSTYDALNRPLTEDYTGQAGTEVTNTYDSCTNGMGRLCVSSTTATRTAYTYDPSGHEASESKSISGSPYYTTQFTYDRAGNVITQTYPDLSQVQYLYGSSGMLDAVTENEYASSSIAIVADLDYGPTGAVTYQKNGNGTETFNTYDQNALYRLTDRRTVGAAGGPLQTLALSALRTGGPKLMLAQPVPSLTNPIEVTSMRTTNSKTFVVGTKSDGSPIYRAQVHQHPIFAPDANGILAPIAPLNESQDTSGNWKITGTGYSANVDKTPSTNLFQVSINGRTLAVGLGTESALTKPSSGSTGTGTYVVNYPGVAGGNDIRLTFSDDTIRKDVVINSLPTGITKTDKGTYDVSFTIAGNGLDAEVDGKTLGSGGTITSTNQARIFDAKGTIGYIYPPEAQDSKNVSDSTHEISISVRYTRTANGITITKLIPKAWLAGAVFPVRADLTFSTFALVGDGHICSTPYPAVWSTQRNNMVGCGAGWADNGNAAESSVYISSTGWLGISRGFIPFDTSSLPDNAVVSSSTLHMYVNSTADGFNDGYDYIGIYQGYQASSSTLTVDDWQRCGNASTSPTELANNLDLTTIPSNAYSGWLLNSTGRSWISATSTTKLCFREGHDATDHEPINNSGSWIQSRIDVASFEAPGTTTDPYLDIEYSYPDTNPATTTEVQVESQTNPTNVTNQTPRFTGRYVDIDQGDTAPYYQIQVATSSTYWGAPTWDSTKTAFATSTPAGQVSSPISYGGTPLLLDSSKYNWRMRFWDFAGNPSPWSSGTDSFKMSDTGKLFQQLHYTYDPVGNITQILSSASSTVQSNYTYDDLNRLSSYSASSTSGTAGEAYTYDILGNLLSKTPTPSSGGYNTQAITLAKASSQSLSHADASQFNITGNLTFETWVKFNSLPSTGSSYTLVSKWGATNQNAYEIAYQNNGGTYRWIMYNTSHGTDSTFVSTTVNYTATTGVWNHVAFVYTASTGTLEVFVNGTSIGSAGGLNTSTTISNQAFRLGSDGGSYFDGSLDDARLWNVARTQAQISANKDTQLTGSESGLAAYYKLNNDYTDSTAGANTLTPSGSPTFTTSVPFAGSAPSGTTYTYAGNTGSSYANPDAATSLLSSGGTSTLAYDNNGNLSSLAGTGYTWDYRNRLTQSVGSSTLTYAYDQVSQRVKLATGTTTTYYPNQFYTKVGTTTEKDIYANGVLVASISNTSGATTTEWVHVDHLGGTNVISDPTGVAVQNTTYYPFGAIKLDAVGTPFNESKKYIGQEFDPQTSLDYLNARYYNSNQGQFLSEDPVFLGNPKYQILTNPQSLNSYAYGYDNPIVNKDPTGKYGELSYSGVTGFTSISAGVRWDANGIDVFGGKGTGIGVEEGVQLAWAPDEYLAHQTEVKLNTSAEIAIALGYRMSQDTIKQSKDGINLRNSRTIGIVTGGGAASSVTAELSIPLVTWGHYEEHPLTSVANIPAKISAYNPANSHTVIQGQYGGLLGGILNSLSIALNKLSQSIASKNKNKNRGH